MILISHRGNVNNINKERENDPEYIIEALDAGYECEVDVWYDNGIWHLGHDSPDYEVDQEFLLRYDIWCHAKNYKALNSLSRIGAHFFWHNTDEYTITSRGHIWAYPCRPIFANCICVLPEWCEEEFFINNSIRGICSDYIEKYK